MIPTQTTAPASKRSILRGCGCLGSSQLFGRNAFKWLSILDGSPQFGGSGGG